MNQWTEYLAAGLVVFTATNLLAVDRYVAWDNAANAATPFTSWTAAATNIQDAVDVSVDNDVIWVAPGTYSVPTNPGVGPLGETNIVTINGLAVTLRSSNGVSAAETVIDGWGRYRGLYLIPGSSERITIEGLTISNCRATNGGAIYMQANNSRTAVVQNCIIRDNTAHSSGGGIYIGPRQFYSFRYELSNCVFQGNQVTNGSGGAVHANVRQAYVKGVFRNCNVISNSASADAGAFFFNDAPRAEIENCVFKHNSAGGRGGVIFSRQGPAIFRNSLFYGNESGSYGEAVGLENNCTFTFVNTTISDHTGDALSMQESGNAIQFVNTIVYNDTLENQGAQSFTNCCLDPAITHATGSNIITNDPGFADEANGNYRLTSASPCRNTGTNQAWMVGAEDLDGNPRLDSRIVDIGAYEYVTYGTAIMVQ